MPIAVGEGQAWLASRWSPASVDLVGAMLLLIKHRWRVFVIFAGSDLW
jgi:hypothetical protein